MFYLVPVSSSRRGGWGKGDGTCIYVWLVVRVRLCPARESVFFFPFVPHSLSSTLVETIPDFYLSCILFRRLTATNGLESAVSKALAVPSWARFIAFLRQTARGDHGTIRDKNH